MILMRAGAMALATVNGCGSPVASGGNCCSSMGMDEFGRSPAGGRAEQFLEESRMDDEALRQIFKQIEDRVVAAQGEAIFAGLMVSSLIPALVAKGVLGRDET